jgi:Lon protease-like protein
VTLLPVFPLDVVVFPGMTIPLNVFEERYKRLVRTRLESEDRRFVIVLNRGSDGLDDGAPQLHAVGSFVEILTAEEQDDGTFFVLAHGQGRCRIEIDHEEAVPEADGSLRPLWIVRAAPWPLERGDPNEERIAAWDAIESFRGYADRFFAPDALRRLDKSIPGDPLYQASFLSANVRVPLASRQVVLEVPSLAGRLRMNQRLIEEVLQGSPDDSPDDPPDGAADAEGGPEPK